ncbi:MAG: hypothetical protein ACK6DB_00780 [Planctomycetota bacterium]
MATEAPENDPALTCPYGRRSIMVAAALWSPQHYGRRSIMVAAALWSPQQYGRRSISWHG